MAPPGRPRKTAGPKKLAPLGNVNFYQKLGENRRPGGYNTRSKARVSEIIGAPSTKRQRNTIEGSSDNDGDYIDNNDYGNTDEPAVSTHLQRKQKRVITSNDENDHPLASSFLTPRRVPPIQRTYSSLVADELIAEDKERELKRRREKSVVDMENNDNESADDEGQIENNGNENSEDEEHHSLIDESEDDDIVIDNDMNGQGDCKSIRSSSSGESSSSNPFSSSSLFSSSSESSSSDQSSDSAESLNLYIPEIINVEIASKLTFTQEDDEQSELSGYSMTDEESLDALSEFSDFDYQNIRVFEGTKRKTVIYQFYQRNLEASVTYFSSYWFKVKELNDKRNEMMYVLNKQLKKSRSFSNTDVFYFNARIGAIESNLNFLVPAITKLQVHFIKDSNQRKIMFGGYKYTQVRKRPTLYSCTYDDSSGKVEGIPFIHFPEFGCSGSVYLDEKGFIQPGTFIKHYHDLLEELCPNLDPAKPKKAVIVRVTADGEVLGKRAKFNHFLEEKLKESTEYSITIHEVNNYLTYIQDYLEKLKSINPAELEEAEQNYLKSSIQWMDFILMHVRIDNFC